VQQEPGQIELQGQKAVRQRMARPSVIEFVQEYGAIGSETAVVFRRGYRTERWSYQRVHEEACRFARELQARGIAKGDTVLLWGAASGAWVAAFFGCVLTGVVVVPLDAGATSEFVLRVGQDTSARLLLHSTEFGEFPAPKLMLETLTETVARHSPAAYASPAITRAEPLEIIFTSGTTAEPRGVVISHGNVLANIEPLEVEIKKYLKYERWVHPVRFLNLLPLSHIFGQMMGLFLPPLLRSEVLFGETLNPSDVVRTIRRERVSVLVAVPRLIESLQREVERELETEGRGNAFRESFHAADGEHFLRRWWKFRKIHRRFGWKFWALISGGAALPQNTETFWTRIGYAVIQGYGMTETTSLISLNHPFKPNRGSIGKVFPGVELKVDATGEILVRGENIARSYRRGDQTESTAGEEGWFHTGDLAEVDESGRLYFKGRRKNVIVTPSGMNIYPADLEAALRKQPEVKDCLVVGIERDGNAEACAVLLLSRPGVDTGTIVKEANRSLAEYQQIRFWLEWPEADFPRTSTHKPQIARIAEVANTRFQPGAAGVAREDSFRTTLTRIDGGIRNAEANSPLGASAELEEQLNLSSLDRVELMSVLESRYQVDLSEAKFSEVATVGQLEKLLQSQPASTATHTYPRWPQSWPTTLMRLAVYYLLVWPATYLLAAPNIVGRENLKGVKGPVLVVCNHVTEIDIGWVLAALPGHFRNRMATAMAGERLTSMRHTAATLSVLRKMMQRIGYFLVTALFNVFPLPQQSGFAKSFAFAGDLADRKWNVLVFPEGKTTEDGRIAEFRGGIGLLATKLGLAVLPLRIDGLFEVKQAGHKFARPGQIRVTIGEAVHFGPKADPATVALDLQRRVEKL
jgi:long-chain acyl-CoA synthetase